jgi:tRNA/rRNA methyltransferase
VLEHPLDTLAEAAPKVRANLEGDAKAKVALLFGSEKTGLSNEELSYCDRLLTIPMKQREGERHLSMNLGQAVAVCLYGLSESEVEAVATAETAAAGAELERLTGLLMSLLESSGYARRHPANAREAVVRRLVKRMGLGENDAVVWLGILRQVLYRLEGGPVDG